LESAAPALVTRRVPLGSIHRDPANARQHPEKNLEAIKASLARFQQVEPLLVQKSTGRLIAGHGRLEAMHELGWTEAEIVELDVDDVTATALAIALNRSSDLAAWDLPALSKLLDSLQSDFELEDLGFDEKAFE
jgi:ParB-like chromosome segregation protein Spo0J